MFPEVYIVLLWILFLGVEFLYCGFVYHLKETPPLKNTFLFVWGEVIDNQSISHPCKFQPSLHNVFFLSPLSLSAFAMLRDHPPVIVNHVRFVFNLWGIWSNHVINPWLLKNNVTSIYEEDTISFLKIGSVSLFVCYELVEREIV